MHLFETVLAMLFGATVLSVLARHFRLPYPTLLALGGALVAFFPGAPRIDLPPELILALFVAPVLLDAAYDTSLRDLKQNWQAVLSLVVVAVGLTTVAVAFTARSLFPDFPWAAAIALGALLAPPDAIAALAVMQQVNPPFRLRKILEGESLLNDASALLIYTLAVGAVTGGGFSATGVLPTFLLTVFGSVAVGWALVFPLSWFIGRVKDAPTAVIFQFVLTFAVWILAERLGLSAVVTVVVFGLVSGRKTAQTLSAFLRVPTFAVWDAVTFTLNVLAFTLIGLQLRPILETLSGAEIRRQLLAALVLLAVVIAVRLAWALVYGLTKGITHHAADAPSMTASSAAKNGLVIGWSGMRGIVTLATALALPENFPFRNFIQLTAFVVVLGTLVLQGLTLRPLLLRLKLPADHTVEAETNVARSVALKAAMRSLDGDPAPAAQRLREEYRAALSIARSGGNLAASPDNALRREALESSRAALEDLRNKGTIGDDAYRQVEAELDVLELMAGTVSGHGPVEVPET